MLVLTRKINQNIVIGDADVVVSVLDVRDGHVRLGFDAPKNIVIYREEILKRLQEQEKTQEKQKAQTVAP